MEITYKVKEEKDFVVKKEVEVDKTEDVEVKHVLFSHRPILLLPAKYGKGSGSEEWNRNVARELAQVLYSKVSSGPVKVILEANTFEDLEDLT